MSMADEMHPVSNAEPRRFVEQIDSLRPLSNDDERRVVVVRKRGGKGANRGCDVLRGHKPADDDNDPLMSNAESLALSNDIRQHPLDRRAQSFSRLMIRAGKNPLRGDACSNRERRPGLRRIRQQAVGSAGKHSRDLESRSSQRCELDRAEGRPYDPGWSACGALQRHQGAGQRELVRYHHIRRKSCEFVTQTNRDDSSARYPSIAENAVVAVEDIRVDRLVTVSVVGKLV
jgi:hypothetical protein